MNVASLNVGIGGNPAGLIAALNQSTQAIQQFGAGVLQINNRVNSAANSIRNLFGTIGLGLGIREVIDYADSWKLVEARLATVTASSSELRRVQNALFRISQDTRSEFEANATLYQRLAQSQRNLNITSEDVIRITRTVAQALAIEGRGVAEVTSTIRQLGQAFASGRFQGDELRSVSENASLLFQKIADNLGVTIGQMRELASENKIAVNDVARAILAAGADIERQAGKLPTTIGGAFVQLRNSVQKFVGETDAALGITARLVAGINRLGDTFDNNRAAIETFAFVIGAGVLVKAVLAARAALLSLAGVQLATTILSLVPAITSVADAMYLTRVAALSMWTAISGPVGITVAAIGVAAAAFFGWRKRIEETRKEMDALRTSLEKLTPTELTRQIQNSLSALFILEDQAKALRATLDSQVMSGAKPNVEQQKALKALGDQITDTTNRLGVMQEVLKALQATPTTPPPVFTAGADAVKTFAEEVGRTIDVFKDMKDGGQQVAGVVERMREQFDRAQRMLRGLKDPFSEQAVRLRKTIQELADLPEIKLRLRIDTTTRELRQMTQSEVDKILATEVPRVQIRPIIDTSLSTRSITDTADDMAARLRDRFHRGLERIQFDVFRDRLRGAVGNVPITFTPVGIPQLNQAVDRAVDAQNRLNLARLGGDRVQIVQAEQAYKVALDQVRESMGVLARAMDGANVKAADQKTAIDAITEASNRLGVALTTAISPLDRLLNVSRAATGIARGLLGIADASRRISDEMRNALQSTVNLFDAVTDLAQAQKDLRAGTGSPFTVAASGLGVAGAGISLINSVVGAIQSDNEKLRQVIREQTEIMRENNQIIERQRVELEGFTGSIGDLNNTIRAIRLPSQVPGAPSMLELIRQVGEFERRGTGPSTRNALEGALRQVGSSLAILSKAADDLGIELFDSAGRLIPDAFSLLADSIELQIKALTRWTDTLEDMRTRMELEADVFDFPAGAQAAIDQGLTLLRTLAPDLFARFFANVDLGDTQAVENALRSLTRILLDNVDLIRDEFGKLMGIDELVEIIRQVEGGLDGLADAANTVTDALLNVPSGFRVERARFEATMTQEMERFQDKVREIFGSPVTPPPIIPSIGVSPSVVEDIQAGAGGDTFIIHGDILVDARERTSTELVATIKRELKDQARGHSIVTRPSTMLDV